VTVNRVKAHDRFDFPLSLFVSMDPIADKVLLRLEYDARFFSGLDACAVMDDYECRLGELAGRHR
jgi:hypothetical protein